MTYYSIGQFSELIGKTPQTLRDWHKKGTFIPQHITNGGTRYYSEEQLNNFLGIEEIENKKIIGYCRVSGKKENDDLERQIENIKTYMIANGYSFEVISDIGSGINYNKKGLLQLIDLITNNEVKKIVILNKDRLLSFGFEVIEILCNKFGVTIEVIDNSEITEETELVDDLIQIVKILSYRLKGNSSHKLKKIIKELSDNNVR